MKKRKTNPYKEANEAFLAGSGDRYEARAWIVENRNYGFSGFEQKAAALEVSIDQLEGAIGLDLYPNLVRLVGVAVAGSVEAGR